MRTFTTIYVTVKGGIQVIWDGNTRVQVNTPDNMKTKMCGLCGDANGNTDNDWTIGDSNLCMDAFPNAKAGGKTNNVNEFGFSWTQAIDTDEASCTDSCPNPPDPDACPVIQEQKAEAHCKPLTDPTGPFKDCLAKMEDSQKKDLFDNCVYDSCHLNDFENVICDHSASMAKICQGAYEVTVTWRSDDLCPMKCGEGMEYKACGNICLPTCSDPKGVNCGDTDGCEEGCFCKEGMVFDGVGSCYSSNKCGCKVPDQGDVYINVGVSYITEDCGQHCACEKAGGDLVCTNNACSANKVCSVKEGVRACYCKAPFVLDGAQCITLNSPCETIDDSQLQCLTCTAVSEEACNAAGKMETCGQSDAICETVVKSSKTGEVTKVTKGCASRTLCSQASLGRDGQDCSDSSYGSSCTQCNYGEVDKDFVCKVADPINVCGLFPDEGKGTQSLTRYYYKPSKGKCVTFTYKGQDGNGNNFSTEEKCQTACNAASIPPECLLEINPGTGSSFTKRFYYDANTNVCKKFNYSGVGGNGNNFKNKDECSNKCKKF
ncbi:hypothetical protein CAPTEDRAFT_158152 [Capitella teleta]|uniref:BPTI/Kunitz inhibitor domain-containing protein n=1 Tax=Capitella teleta TaxID=283909 RepID=R7UVN9_CAPTE|nr:hypothetical protein CAPTEDRAFT_158152 [Capitella teleta]|eukprot:ELU10327.1 hypothetical protein CAPTEDRAFT_158152 [Capitella teleta]